MAIISAEEQARLDSLGATVATMFDRGGPAVRDALRYVANQMLAHEHSFLYEQHDGRTPDIEDVYHELRDLQLTGTQRKIRNPDLISSLENLMNKNEREIFGSAVRNISYTMFKLLPQNENTEFCLGRKGPHSSSRTPPRTVAERLQRGLMYLLTSSGLDSYIKKPENQIRSYGHTRLSCLVLAVAVKGETQVAVRTIPLWRMDEISETTGEIELVQDLPNVDMDAKASNPVCSTKVVTDFNVWSQLSADCLIAIMLKHEDHVEADLRGLSRTELNDAYSEFVDDYLEDNDDDDEEWDEEDEEDEDEDPAFDPAEPNRLSVSVTLPVIDLDRPKLDLKPGMRLKTKRAKQDRSQNILIDPVWHAVDQDNVDNIHYFSLSIVARDTVGHQAISASPLEALTISNVLMQITETSK